MPENTSGYQRFFAELKRRQVFKVTAIYGAVAFGILQVADPLAGALDLPDSFLRLVVALLLLGFPVALVLAWAFELTPAGVRKAESAAPGEIEAIVAQPASRRWPAGLLALAGIVALVVGAVWVGRQTAPVRQLNLAVPEAHASDVSTLAVLPFENVGDDDENEVLASGLHMDLQDQLGRLSALRVTSPMSVREYEATEKGDQEIAAELGVDYLLRGSVRRSGSRARIFVQLVDAETSENLWTDQFDREVTADNLFDIQSDIARQVAGQLATELSPSDLAALDEEPPSDDMAAIAAYNRARVVYYTPGRGDDIEDAVAYAERAVELDPEFVAAWAFLARLRTVQAYAGNAETAPALQAVLQTESLAPGSVEAITARAVYTAYVEQELAVGLEQLQEAERLTPSDAYLANSIAGLHRRLGQWDEALSAHRRALELNPRSPVFLNGYAYTLQMMGRYTAADQVLERALQVGASIPGIRAQKVLSTFYETGDAGRARSLAIELGLDPSEDAEGSALFHVALFDGDLEAAARYADQVPRSESVVGEAGRLWRRAWVAQVRNEDTEALGDSLLALDWSSTQDSWDEMMGSIAYALQGDEDRAWPLLDESIRIARSLNDRSASVWQLGNAAFFGALFGRTDESFELLDEIVDLPGSWMSLAELQHDPSLASLRDDPRFDEILERRRAFEEQAAREAEADRPWLP